MKLDGIFLMFVQGPKAVFCSIVVEVGNHFPICVNHFRIGTVLVRNASRKSICLSRQIVLLLRNSSSRATAAFISTGARTELPTTMLLPMLLPVLPGLLYY